MGAVIWWEPRLLRCWLDVQWIRTAIQPSGRCKKSLRTTSLCSHIFSGPQGSWSVHVYCLHSKMEFRSCAREHQWCGIIHYYWWTASIKPRLLFSRAGYASWELSLLSVLLIFEEFSLTCHVYTVKSLGND